MFDNAIGKIRPAREGTAWIVSEKGMICGMTGLEHEPIPPEGYEFAKTEREDIILIKRINEENRG